VFENIFYIYTIMTIPTPEIRLAILFAGTFAITLFVAIIIIFHSLGNMANHLKRMEFIISKEIILRYNQQVNYYKQQRQRAIAKQEREKRQAALLEIPLVRNADQKKRERL
jgi:sensor histidine kinase YesM